MTDTELLGLLRERDEKALEELQQQYGRYCYAIAAKLLQNGEEAEEIVNDVLLKSWQSIPPADPDNLRLYLAKLTRNAALNRLEWNSAQKRRAIQVQLDELEFCIPDSLSALEPEQQALKQVLNGFLRELKGEYRQMFVRRYWYGDSVQELSQRFGCSHSRVTGILFRVRKELKKRLEKEDLL